MDKEQSAAVARSLSQASSTLLHVRLIRVSEPLRALVLRRHRSSNLAAAAAAYNMGVRLASSQRVLCTGLGTLFADGFFQTLSTFQRTFDHTVQVAVSYTHLTLPTILLV
eukprot:5634515-Amphidinium_carterae.1